MSYHRKSKNNFSEEELDILVDFVKKNEVLYDPQHELYGKTRNRMALWKEIAKTLRKDSKDCMNRWGNTRSYYARHSKSGVPAACLPEFTRRRLEQLAFLECIENKPAKTKKPASAPADIKMCPLEVFEIREVECEVELLDSDGHDDVGSEQFDDNESAVSSQSERLLSKCNESPERKYIPTAHAPSFEVSGSKKKRSAQQEKEMLSPVTRSANKNHSKFVPTKPSQSKAQPSHHIVTTTTAAAEITKTARLSGLEHYFAGICETVSRFPPIRQAKIKMEISALVGNAEIEILEEVEQSMCY